MNAQQRVQRQLEEVLTLPGNESCADCHAPAPRWASVNLGIFLCISCASEHRKMGTHRSRVKSVTLDEWTRDQVATMRQIGNIRSNEIYNPDERKNPPPLANSTEERDSEIAKYIRRKYELGAFKQGAAPSLATSNAITSRARARDGRDGHSGFYENQRNPELNGVVGRRPSAPPVPTAQERDLPALPISPSSTGSQSQPSPRRTRPVRSSTAPMWNSLAPVNTSGTGVVPTLNISPPPRKNSFNPSLPPPRRVTPQPPTPTSASSSGPSNDVNLLIDLTDSTTSTRPLQINGFPAVPAWTPAQQVASPGALTPSAVGQPAFSPMATGNGNNPFFAAMGQQQRQQQQQMLQSGGISPMSQSTFGQSPFSGGMAPIASPAGMSVNSMTMGMNAGANNMGMNVGPNGMAMGGANGMNGMTNMSGMNHFSANGMNNTNMNMNNMNNMNGMNGMNGMNMNGMNMNSMNMNSMNMNGMSMNATGMNTAPMNGLSSAGMPMASPVGAPFVGQQYFSSPYGYRGSM